jgi:transaldolase
MAIFLDSSKLEDIKKYRAMGVIRGVTTNPTILLKEGVTGGMAGVKARIIEVAKLMDPYPVSCEVTTNDRQGMIDQGKDIASWAKNINVKITIHGPKGELDNLSVIHELETKHNIRVNVTAMMSAQQCFLAAMAGATYVSILSGRVNNMGYDSISEIQILRNLLDEHNLKAQIIAASTREIMNITQWLSAGAHIVTVAPQFIDGMIVHPYTKETVQMFLDDAAKAGIK